MKKIINTAIWPVILAPLVFLAIKWKDMSETVALHFDFKGNPDRYGSKKELIVAAIVLTALNLFVYFLLTNIYRIDPKKYAAENRDRLKRMAFAVCIFISALLCVIIYSSLEGNAPVSMGLILSGVGLLFAVIGNYMPNLKPNYFAGFRLPWTLENEKNWKKTHAIAGKLWFGGGLFLAVACLFLPPTAALVTFFAVMLTISIIPMVVSYKEYVRNKQAGNKDIQAP